MADTYSYTYQTRGDSSPHGKPKIYLSGCHTKDRTYFDSAVERLLDLYNAVIWQRDDQITDYNLEELGQMQVCIFLITEHFLKETDAIWIREWHYAMQHQFPILPIIIDEHVQEEFNKYLGNIQCYRYRDEFMNPDCDKLTELFDALLLNDQMRARILGTFDRSIFLSYRKKDISYVVSLMKAIHKCPGCWDVRIWYDAYLLPGRNFDDSIKNSLITSDMMALLVTPSLLELPNYVHDPEYRIACEQALPVIPIEMESTDLISLRENYQGILSPVKYNDTDQLDKLVLRYLPQNPLNHSKADESSYQEMEHRYLVGLAYLYGIEVEVDHKHALKYMVMAAEGKIPEAYKQLVTMYRNGIGVGKNLLTAIEWQKKYIALLEKKVKQHDDSEPFIEISDYSKRYREYIREIWNLGEYYAEGFMYEEALQCYQMIETEATDLLQIDAGENTYHLLSVSYALCGDAYMSMGLADEAKSSYSRYLDNAQTTYKHFQTTTAKRDLSLAYHRLGDLCKENRNLDDAYSYYEKYAELVSVEDGSSDYQERRDLWLAYKNLAEIQRENGNEADALALFEKSYEIAHSLAVEQRTPNAYRDLSICLDRIGMIKSSMGDISGALDSFEQSLVIRRNLLEDTQTTDAAIALCASLDYCGDCASRQYRYDDALGYYVEALNIRKHIQSEFANMGLESNLATSLVKVGDIYLKMDQPIDAKNCYLEAFAIREHNYNKKHTHENRRNLAIACQRMGNLLCRMEDSESALHYYERNMTLCKEILVYDISHQAKRDYKVSIVKMAEATEDLEQLEKAYEWYQEYYGLCIQLVEEYGYLMDYDDLAVACFSLGRFGDEDMMRKAYNLYSQMADQFPNDQRYKQNRDYIKNTFFS